MCYSVDEIKRAVTLGAENYNADAAQDARIRSVALFGSYAQGSADDDSDVDLLVSFASPVVSFFTLARALECMEGQLGVSVDMVQDPLPADALLEIGERIPLYEAA